MRNRILSPLQHIRQDRHQHAPLVNFAMYSPITTFAISALLALLTHPVHSVLAPSFSTLSYDTSYGVENTPLTTFACSDGVNGLEIKGYTTLDSLRNFPYIGGAPTVLDWNDTNCGKCYTVTYGGAASISIVAMDAGLGEFVVSPQAMDALTGGQAKMLGRVDVTYVEADPSVCQL